MKQDTWLDQLNADLKTNLYFLVHLPSGVYAVRDLTEVRILLRQVGGVQYNFNRRLTPGEIPSTHRLKNEMNWTQMDFE